MKEKVKIHGWSLTRLAKRFPAAAPKPVLHVFWETLTALGLKPTKYKLVYISREALQFAEKKARNQRVFDFIAAFNKVPTLLRGHCSGRTAYVMQGANRTEERVAAIHEAIHFVFGPHPWPHERRKA